MARDASIESYLIRFICYDRTFNKNIMFTYDVGYNDDSKYIRNDEEDIKFFLTTSKRRFDIECKKLDKDLNKETNELNDNTDGEEGQDS